MDLAHETVSESIICSITQFNFKLRIKIQENRLKPEVNWYFFVFEFNFVGLQKR